MSTATIYAIIILLSTFVSVIVTCEVFIRIIKKIMFLIIAKQSFANLLVRFMKSLLITIGLVSGIDIDKIERVYKKANLEISADLVLIKILDTSIHSIVPVIIWLTFILAVMLISYALIKLKTRKSVKS